MTREQFLAKLAQAYPRAVVVDVATVLHVGWEMDNYIALVREEGELRYIGTDHGRVCGVGRDVVMEAITVHERATESCRRLLALADKTQV